MFIAAVSFGVSAAAALNRSRRGRGGKGLLLVCVLLGIRYQARHYPLK
jgi:hypothetical protein